MALLRQFPRLSLTNLARLPTHKHKKIKMGSTDKRQGYGQKGNKGRQLPPALGYEAGNSPITKTTPKEPSYNYGYQ